LELRTAVNVLSKEDEMGRHVLRMGEVRNAYKFFFGKPEGTRRLERSRHRGQENNETDFRDSRDGSVV
jgi:hypothetical protein